VSIDSLSPRFASANSTITVTGTITNHTGTPLQGVQVQLWTSPSYFTGRSEMDSFSGGSYFPLSPTSGNQWYSHATLHSGATLSWTASFPAAQQGYTAHEVYPIEAVALSSGYSQLGNARTFLPYWPAGASAPDKLKVAWVWPLIDEPQQGACSKELATNNLASSFAAGGRLNGLLAAGVQYAGSTDLTWAVDPALLSDATVMTKRYKVGGNGVCTGTTGMPASQDAGTWLDHLKTATDSEPTFVTPYADPDVSALTHAGLDSDLSTAYALGNSKAQQVLGQPFGQDPTSTIAWPANGAADASVLSSLAHDGGVGTTILSSTEMPAQSSASGTYLPDNAVTSTTTGIGTKMSVLLADAEITKELGSASATSPASAQFSVEQDYLARSS
jgi:hypothetical protein